MNLLGVREGARWDMWFGNHVDPGFVAGSRVGRDWLWNQEGTGPLGAHLGVGGVVMALPGYCKGSGKPCVATGPGAASVWKRSFDAFQGSAKPAQVLLCLQPRDLWEL